MITEIRDEVDVLNHKVAMLEQSLANTKLILGTALLYLQTELGVHNVEKLMEELNRTKP